MPGRPEIIELINRDAAAAVYGGLWFTDDLPEPPGMLHAAVCAAAVADAPLLGLDLAGARAATGVRAVLTAADVAESGPFGRLLADRRVAWLGQPTAVIAADSREQAIAAARLIQPYYDRGSPTVDGAGIERVRRRGDVEGALAAAPLRLQGRLEVAARARARLEPPTICVAPLPDGGWLIQCAADETGAARQAVAAVLGAPMHAVQVECRRVGGGLDGINEAAVAAYACLVALLARACGRPVKLHPDRQATLAMNGRRHRFQTAYDVGFDADGRVLGLSLSFTVDCGAAAAELCGPLLDRAAAWAATAYPWPAFAAVGRTVGGHAPPDAAATCSGPPQLMAAIEQAMERVAAAVGRDPLDVRLLNLGDGPAAATLRAAAAAADYRRRRAEADAFNAAHPQVKRGLTALAAPYARQAAAAPQAVATLCIHPDGSVTVGHGGVENGQGVAAKLTAAAAAELGIPTPMVKAVAGGEPATRNGCAAEEWAWAAAAAARQVRERLAPYLAAGEDFAAAARAAHQAGICLAAAGCCPPPDPAAGTEAAAAVVAETETETATGARRTLRVDLLSQEAGTILPAIDRARLEGAFAAGLDWGDRDATAAIAAGRETAAPRPLACDFHIGPAPGPLDPTQAVTGRYDAAAAMEAALSLGLSARLSSEPAGASEPGG